jgi:hypothetical protein
LKKGDFKGGFLFVGQVLTLLFFFSPFIKGRLRGIYFVGQGFSLAFKSLSSYIPLYQRGAIGGIFLNFFSPPDVTSEETKRNLFAIILFVAAKR